MKKWLLVSIAFFSLMINAQVASDNAGNYSSWATGNNAGSGFSNWDMWVSGGGNSGFFLGDAVAQGFGNINTGGKAFGMFANGLGSPAANAQRGFNYSGGNTSLQNGHTFKIDLAVAFRNGFKGIDIFQVGFTNVFNFNVGGDKYEINYGATNIDLGWAYSQTSIFTIEITQASQTLIWVKVTRGSDVWGPTQITVTDRVSHFKCYIGSTEAGDLNNLYFNSMEIRTDNPLPVELTSFTAAISGKNVILNWTTATEINNYGFEVERKNSGQNWNKIGFVNGYGNSNSLKEYSFTDKSTTSGKYFYRLKQIDTDGTYEYSPEVEVVVIHPKDFSVEQNYPNPFNPETKITFSVPQASHVKVTVFNLLGQEITTLLNESKEAGQHTIDFNAEGLNSGVYLYKIEAGNFVQVKKMVLNK